MMMKPTLSFDRSRELFEGLQQSRNPHAADSLTRASEAPEIDPQQYLEARIYKVFVKEDMEDSLLGLNAEAELYLIGVALDNISSDPLSFKVDTFRISSSDPSDDDTPESRPDRLLQFGSTGWSFYRSPNGKLPTYLDLNMVLFESDEDLRETGQIMKDLATNEELKGMKNSAIAMLKSASTATWAGFASNMALQVVGLIGKYLVLNQDDVISHLQASHSTAFGDIGNRDFKFSDHNAGWWYGMRQVENA
ncbi:hypothetical protein KQI65_02990 [bacterium]|nr:hypothetical protein [bacterium]